MQEPRSETRSVKRSSRRWTRVKLSCGKTPKTGASGGKFAVSEEPELDIR